MIYKNSNYMLRNKGSFSVANQRKDLRIVNKILMSNVHLTHYLKNKNKVIENALINFRVRYVARTENPKIPEVMARRS